MSWIDRLVSRTISPRFRLLALGGSIAVGAIGIADFFLTFHVWQVVTGKTSVKVSCPFDVEEDRADVIGRWEGGKSDDVVRIYVSPRDGTNKYWLQDPQPQHGNLFSHRIHLGNPCGYGHEKPDWPLQFDVYAFLVPLAKEGALPGGSPGQPPFAVVPHPSHLMEMLSGLGVLAHDQCTITRTPPCDLPRMRAFAGLPSECSLPNFVGRSIDLSWVSGPDSLDVEVFAIDGRKVMPRKTVTNPGSITVPIPGIYEFKFRDTRRSDCVSSQWARRGEDEQRGGGAGQPGGSPLRP